MWDNDSRIAIGLGVLPAVVRLLVTFVVSVLPISSAYWLIDVLTLITGAAVVGIAIWQTRQLTVWSLPAIGVCIPALLNLFTHGIYSVVSPGGSAVGYGIVQTLKTIWLIAVVGGALAGAVWTAQTWGNYAAMLLIPLLAEFSMSILDPTYGLAIRRPGLAILVALFDLAVMVPFLIGVPALALRAKSERDLWLALLISPALGYGLAIFIDMLRALLVQGAPGYPPLGQMLVRSIGIGVLYGGAFMLVLAGIVWGLGWVYRSGIFGYTAQTEDQSSV